MEKKEESEINKLAVIVGSLNSMTPQEKERSMRYLTDRYGCFLDIKHEIRKVFLLKISGLRSEPRKKSSVIALRKAMDILTT
jgi:hypothetical protein